MSIQLALADAARNCVRENAKVVLTLRSGVQIKGKLQQSRVSDLGTHYVDTPSGGWVAVLDEEIAAVESTR